MKTKTETWVWNSEDSVDERILQLFRNLPSLSSFEIEDVLEFLEENSFLSKEGERFRKEFWEMFIKTVR